MAKAKAKVKVINPVAMALRTNVFRKRVVKSKKIYDRKKYK